MSIFLCVVGDVDGSTECGRDSDGFEEVASDDAYWDGFTAVAEAQIVRIAELCN